MASNIFVPVNRHFLIEPIDKTLEEAQTEHGILLPEDYKPIKSEHAAVKILDWAEDVSTKPMDEDAVALVERSMIKTIEHAGDEAHLILENYIICLVYNEEPSV